MIKLLLTSLFITIAPFTNLEACTIESFPQIIKLNKVLDDSVVSKTNCSTETVQTFVELLTGATGELKSTHLSQILKSEFNKDIIVKPNLIKVEFINDTIERLVQIPKNLALKKTTSLHDRASLNLSNNVSINASCNTCSTAGEKNIKLKVGSKTIWFSAKILMKRVGFVAIKNLSPYTNKLEKSSFRQTTLFDNGRDHLFQDIDNIRFYKPTRQIQQGKFLKVSDLMPMTIIKPGKKVKVILKGKTISLNSSALARQAGKIGQTIEVYNKKTNKKITGLVIDFNTVMVEL
jgi:flagella basal body P-ring formation protein FlgA